jgi:hypothetical protein
MKNLMFDDLAKFAQDHWGLTLVRNEPTNRGRWHGCWKTGFSLTGKFPGSGHEWRRYNSLREVARVLGYENA